MNEDVKKKTVMVIDNGLYVSFARILAKGFGKVYYHTPFASSFPSTRQLCVGGGFDDIERCDFPLAIADKVDLWIFLDLYHYDLQLYLEKHGARVWGARRGEEMELHRWEFKQHLKTIGLPVQPIQHIVGIDNLIESLKKVKNKYVKTSFTRGDFETFRHDTFELSQPRLEEIKHTLGPAGVTREFLIEDEISDAVEVGYDGFSVDGKFPSHAMMAYEIKDTGMIGVSLVNSKLAEPVRVVNDKLSPTLRKYNYRGFLSTEIRYTKDKKTFFIDPCCRLGTPSNELLQELFEDWPMVLWYGAKGEVYDQRVKAKYAVMAVIHSEWAVNDWQSIHFPKEIDNFVKLRFHTRIKGRDYVVPQTVGMPDLGGVVGSGKTLLDAIKQCAERAKEIKGFQVTVSLESIYKAIETIKQGEKMGIRFGDDPIPTKEQVEKAIA